MMPIDTVFTWIVWAFITGACLGVTAGAGLMLLARVRDDARGGES
jgi:amino acid permease